MFRALYFFARSLKRIADAIEEQNRITKYQLELQGIVMPDPKRKFTKSEREVEVVYGEQPFKEEDEFADVQ